MMLVLIRLYLVVEYATMLSGPRGPYLRSAKAQAHIPLRSELAERALSIQNGVTLPLIEQIGVDESVLHVVDELLDLVHEADSFLGCGTSLSLRELELKLIHDARVSVCKIRQVVLANPRYRPYRDVQGYTMPSSSLSRIYAILQIPP